MGKQRTLADDFESDGARYRRCSEPHESPAAADKALQTFFAELSALREKHRIRDLYVVAMVGVTEKDGTETSGTAAMGYGARNAFLPMTAYAYGREKRDSEESIRKLLAGASE